eukprot:gene36723-49507_t
MRADLAVGTPLPPAGEGDHAQRGGGGSHTFSASGSPLPAPAAPPSPAGGGRTRLHARLRNNADCRFSRKPRLKAHFCDRSQNILPLRHTSISPAKNRPKPRLPGDCGAGGVSIPRGVPIAAVLALLAIGPAFAQSSSLPPTETSSVPDVSAPVSTVPEELQGMIGDFVLEQEDESLPKCALKLTDQEAIGGWAVEVPEACPPPYPAADSLTAWNIDPNDGSVILLDAERHV